MAFYTGDAFPWRGNAIVAALEGERLIRIVLEHAPGRRAGWRAVAAEPLFKGELGRIPAVVMGPDGHLYLTTSNRDGHAKPSPGVPDLRPQRLAVLDPLPLVLVHLVPL
jgi:aldose sugar dehydrogenase